jgi:uracil-DNA glycosylase
VSRPAPGFPPAERFFPPRRTLAALARAAQECRACPLYRHATQAVFGEGRRDARMMLVGEQPGDQEDLRGHPFVGAAGKMLDRCLAEAGLVRGELWLTNAVKHFKFEPRGKRRIHKKPNTTEVQACFPWLEIEVEKVGPEMIVCLGATATRALLGPEVSVERDHGTVYSNDWAPWVMPTYHPSALLRAPDEQRERKRETLVADLRVAASRYRELAGASGQAGGTKHEAGRAADRRERTGESRHHRRRPGGEHATRQGTRGAGEGAPVRRA